MDNDKRKKPLGRSERLRISNIRKGITSTFAELRIQRTYPAAPLRIWLIHTLIVSLWVWKSSTKGRKSEFSGCTGCVSCTAFLFLAKQKDQPKLTRLLLPQLALRLDFLSLARPHNLKQRPDDLIFGEIKAVGVRRSLALTLISADIISVRIGFVKCAQKQIYPNWIMPRKVPPPWQPR